MGGEREKVKSRFLIFIFERQPSSSELKESGK
jgi:hypothetical protein